MGFIGPNPTIYTHFFKKVRMKKNLLALAFAVLTGVTCISQTVPDPGLDSIVSSFRALPLLRQETRVHYLGSIDKMGGNADWDWGLYQDNAGEWVLAEIEGPGCLWNFVVHHDVARSDPLYSFYFDGEKTPRFTIHHSEMGGKPPFIVPLADWYGPRLRHSQDDRITKMDFRIIRSFVPMPFTKGCRITSSVKLEGNSSPQSGAGGWGHAIYHTYSSTKGLNVETFTGKENLVPLLSWASNIGNCFELNFIPAEKSKISLAPNANKTLFSADGEGVIRGVRIRGNGGRKFFQDVWIRCTWENESAPALELPLSTFFGNDRIDHSLQTMAMGLNLDGYSYHYFPMPYWKAARVELINHSVSENYECDLDIYHQKGHYYEQKITGHFRATPWRSPKLGPIGEDALIGEIKGHGQIVAGVVGALKGCEGDVRVNIDGCSTPSVQSDGSESWACYGWGYYSAPESNPFSAYDGPERDASMVRLLLGDFYPFHTSLRMSVEPPNGVRTPDKGNICSGSLFWYGELTVDAIPTDVLDVGDLQSERAHAYKANGGTLQQLTTFFEGAQDHLKITDEGRHGFDSSEFIIKIDPSNQGVILRRRSSQAIGRHRALVEVDGTTVSERAWIWPDQNQYKSWLEDEFQIPASYTAGKSQLRIRIIPEKVNGVMSWNEYRYTAFSIGVANSSAAIPIEIKDKDLPPLPN